jgi:chorismate mutase/prephenate dehydratase
LQDFEKANINLSKIESRPAKNEDTFGYWFYIDFFGHIDDKKIQNVLSKHNSEVTWLGSYVSDTLKEEEK